MSYSPDNEFINRTVLDYLSFETILGNLMTFDYVEHSLEVTVQPKVYNVNA